jgi:hypothetical protein
MIQVDLYVPMLNEIYDFEWNGQTLTGEIVRQSLELIERKEEVAFEAKDYYLYALDLGRVLDPEQKLICQGVLAGEPFVLI